MYKVLLLYIEYSSLFQNKWPLLRGTILLGFFSLFKLSRIFDIKISVYCFATKESKLIPISQW